MIESGELPLTKLHAIDSCFSCREYIVAASIGLVLKFCGQAYTQPYQRNEIHQITVEIHNFVNGNLADPISPNPMTSQLRDKQDSCRHTYYVVQYSEQSRKHRREEV